MKLVKLATGFLALTIACSPLCPPSACAAEKTLTDWFADFASAEDWFGEGFAYDITDEKACWELLQKPITVLSVGEREVVYPLMEPGGKKVNNDEYGGYIAGTTAAVHVLGKDEDGWTLIEGMDEYDRLIRGYVRTKLLKTVTPNKNYGVIIDKLTQRLYVFVDGELFSSCAVSTGLATAESPYNETASGEYLISSWVGDFENEGMICEKGMRFNNGDLLHQVPYMMLGDGTKRFTNYEANLGTKASHGCIRVARYPNDDRLDIQWLWKNLKKNTKVLIWDDDGRRYPYPEDGLALYYNTQGGARYHISATCSGVKPQYYPLASFRYGELDTGVYAKLEPCDFCTPAKRRVWIDAYNLARGVVSEAEIHAAFAPETDDEDDEVIATQSVEIVIVSNGSNE